MVSGKENPLSGLAADPFDRVVVLTIAALLLAAALLVWRGDRVGVGVSADFAGSDDEAVPAGTDVRLSFGQAMNTAAIPEIVFDPPVTGTARWQGAKTLVFKPDAPLAAETTYTVSLGAGLESREGRPVLKSHSWEFRTRPLHVLYLAWNEDNYYQLFSIPAEGGSPTPLTFPPDDVLDFAVSPDGTMIVYSSYREDGGSDLYAVDSRGENRRLVLDCANGACSNPSWEPNGRRLIYERRTFTAGDGTPGPPRLWWLDLSSNQTVAVFEDTQWLGSFARFSPDGQWLAYISPNSQEIQVYHLEDGRSIRIPSSSGEPPTWSADSRTVLITEIDFSGEQYSIYMYEVVVETAEVTQLSGSDQVIDGWPTWSPDGEWIAFNRKPPTSPIGKQLWMMQPGERVVQLTDSPGLHHGPPAWSPDGRWLVHQQFAQAEPNAEPEIWLLNVTTGVGQKLASPGIQPAWLP